MIERKLSYLLIASIAISSISCASYIPQSRGRKLFGGYRIAPKICEPTNPGRIKSNAPAICMFNYECSRRKGEVVGACMDGFLFGACCQLPARESIDNLEKISISEDPLLNIHELDHVPDIPILLNPDGTPVGSIVSDPTTKSTFSSVKLSTTSPKNSYKNTERPQFVDLSHLENDFSILLGHDQVLDDLKLPSLITHSDSNNDIHEQQHHHEASVDSPITTLLSPDQILQVADPVDQLPALFSHGLQQNNETGAETILLNEYGKPLNDSYNPDDIFKPTNIENITVQTTTEKLRTSLKTLPARHSTIQMTPMTERTTAAAKKETTSTVLNTHKNTQKNPNTKNTIKTTTNSIKSSNKTSTTTKKATTPISTKTKLTPATTKSSFSTYSATTPMTLSTRNDEDFIRVPTITYGGQSGNKKHDELDKEEIAINHIISILNNSKVTTQVTNGPTTYKWVSPDGLSKPTLVKISPSYPSLGSTESMPSTYYNSASSPNYYQYNVAPTEPSRPISSYYTSSDSLSSYSTQSGNYLDSSASTSGSSSSSNNYGYSSRPTTNPPAPTVIVLGPLGTDYTTIPTQSTPTRFGDSTQKYSDVVTKVTTNTARPTLITSKPSVSTTFTHNISTVISGNKQVVSVSFVSVNSKDGTTSKPTTLKDKIDQAITESNSDTKFVTKRPSTVYTTLTSWSEKPGFYLKPSSPNFEWPIHDSEDELDKVTNPEFTTTGSNCDEETVTSDDLNNFPPVRHPELESSVTHLQEKPTPVEGDEIITEDEIPTPDFVEDAELNNKVDVFVNKIVESLQGNFQNLKDVVYNPKNVSTVAPSVVTKKPVAAPTTKRPATTKPTIKGTRKPITTRVTTTQKISTAKPKPTSVGTRKPTVTTKRTKPVKKITTPIPITNTEVEAELETTTAVTIKLPEVKPNSDFRTICGIRPLIKSGRIVGGKGANFAEYPWQVLVREATWLGLFTKNKCGGVLITDKYVITAAHCQPGFLASLVAVFGEYDISGELEPKRSVTRNVRRVIVNRAYDPATFENDLALLELESPIQFDVHIVPICMPDEGIDYVNRIAVVTGWGRLKYNGGVPSVLQEVRVPIMENAVCQDMFRAAGHSKLILDSFMCAGYANGQKDSCEGDSGGPLTLQRSDGRWVLVGTVSHGIKCAAPYLPGVYMRTTYFKPWLHSITGV